MPDKYTPPSGDISIIERLLAENADLLVDGGSADSLPIGCELLIGWSKAPPSSGGWRGPVTAYFVSSNCRSTGVIGFAPQVIGGIRIRSLAGYYWPYRSFLAEGEPTDIPRLAHTLATHLNQHAHTRILRFGPISPACRPTLALLEGLEASGWTTLRRCLGSVFELEIPSSEKELEMTAGKSFIRSIDYSRRKLERDSGRIEIQRYPLREPASELLAELAEIERKSWVFEKGGDLKFFGKENREFWEAVASSYPKSREHAVVWILRINDRPVAFSAHLEKKGIIHIIANSYDSDFKSYGCGSILTLEIFRDAISRGISRVDWGMGDSGYKARWGAKPTGRLYDVLVLRIGALGRLAELAVRLSRSAWRPGLPSHRA